MICSLHPMMPSIYLELTSWLNRTEDTIVSFAYVLKQMSFGKIIGGSYGGTSGSGSGILPS